MPVCSLDVASSTWRLLTTGFRDGVANMAIDEAILLSVSAGTSLPTLRFYGWKPPCVSVGYAQSLRGEVDLDACRALGYTWVRRPTGGRAVLHIDELTYSVAAPQADPRVAGDILTSYRRLSLGLVSGLRLLGCDATQAARQHNRDAVAESAACFDVPAPYEVTALGRKLVGSAQARRRGVVLQHGSLPLTGDVARLADVLSLPAHGRQELREKLCRRAIVLDEALGRAVSWEEAAAALAEGFVEALNLRLEPGGLSAGEQAEADRLQALHAGDEWMLGSS
ncbi:MAG: lipoate--protein ligase family protein [Anaerolineae bacterium]|nr:lipoate--protein ligase family protein [Anaerolineae bacterium]